MASLAPVQKDVDIVKTDVALLRTDLYGFAKNITTQLDKLYVAIADLREEVDEKIDKSEQRMVHQFHVIAEQIHHDAIGAKRDEIEVVKDRVTRLERRTGIMKT